MARGLARSLSIARELATWRGVAAGTGTTRFPRSRLGSRGPAVIEEAKSILTIASRVEELLLPRLFASTTSDHGERLGQEEQGHDDALFNCAH